MQLTRRLPQCTLQSTEACDIRTLQLRPYEWLHPLRSNTETRPRSINHNPRVRNSEYKGRARDQSSYLTKGVQNSLDGFVVVLRSRKRQPLISIVRLWTLEVFQNIFFSVHSVLQQRKMGRVCVRTEFFVNSLRWLADVRRTWVNARQIGCERVSIVPVIVLESIFNSIILCCSAYTDFAVHTIREAAQISRCRSC